MRQHIFRLLAASVLTLLLSLFFAAPSHAQQEQSVAPQRPSVHLTLGGTFQSRVSYTWLDTEKNRERIGFGVRRARLRANATIGKRAGVALQIEGAGSTPVFLDVEGIYHLSDRIRLRLGRMTSAQPAAFQPTSHSHIDAVDRAAIAGLWGSQTIGSDGRDFGVDLRYATSDVTATLFFSNGDGNWSRTRGNFREGIAAEDPTRGVENGPDELAISFMGSLHPDAVAGLQVGGFVSYNGSENPNTAIDDEGRAYISYAGHLYWGVRPGSQPLRIKADVISILYEDVLRFEQQTLGYSILGAAGLGNVAEVFARFERYDDNTNLDDDTATFLTGGASLSLSALRGGPYYQERLSLAFSTRRPEANSLPNTGLVVLQAQFVF